jgi:predicted dithiol-disulfide oxidoreductase (DUF899 family)
MNAEIEQIEKQIQELKEQRSAARRRATPQPVKGYRFRRPDGTAVTLSELFGDKPDLIVVHNMGRACPYCTVWADGIQSLADHLQNRTAFALVSPDEPGVIKEFANSRGWRLPAVSGGGTTFAHDMGFEPEPKKYWPGVSGFRKNAEGSIVRTGKANFGPGDDFCPLWNLFDLLEGGAGNWEPKYSYPPR